MRQFGLSPKQDANTVLSPHVENIDFGPLPRVNSYLIPKKFSINNGSEEEVKNVLLKVTAVRCGC